MKSVTKYHLLHSSISMKCPEKQIYVERKISDFLGLEVGIGSD